jgi:hypothetical protein
VVVGVVLYLVNALIPMDPKVKMVLNAVVGLLLLIWFLSFVGLLPGGTLGVGAGRWCR